MKTRLFCALLLLGIQTTGVAQNAAPENDALELCVADACAIPLRAKELEGTVYIVRTFEDYELLGQVFQSAKFFIANERDYTELKKGRESFVFQAEVERAKAGAKAAPLVSGSITVNISTGGASCADCHTGSWKQIHSGVMTPKKNDNGQ